MSSSAVVLDVAVGDGYGSICGRMCHTTTASTDALAAD